MSLGATIYSVVRAAVITETCKSAEKKMKAMGQPNRKRARPETLTENERNVKVQQKTSAITGTATNNLPPF